MRSDIMRAFKNKDGIALVVVLGMLAVLVVMGVAFSVSMRTERIATRSYMDVVKARHLAVTALYRVLAEDISAEMLGRVYPPWDAYTASSVNNELSILMTGSGYTGQPALFVPASLRAAAEPLGRAPNGVDWLELRDPIDDEFYGEYAFLIVNNSGLLDANVVGAFEGTQRPRGRGVDPGEIRFSSSILPEAMNSSLNVYRDEFRRFESVPELYYLTSTAVFSSQFIDVAPERRGPPLKNLPASLADNLHVFSRYPRGYAELEAGQFVARSSVGHVGAGTPWDDETIAGITNALSNLSPSLIPDVEAFVGVMHDYSSPNYVLYPGPNSPDSQFNRISSMRVPMINEVVVSNQFLLTGNPEASHNLRHIVYVTVETWYPFPESNADRFRVELGDGTGIRVNMISPAAAFWPDLNGQYAILEDYPQPAPEVGFSSTPNSYRTTTFAYFADQPVIPFGPDNPDNITPSPHNLEFTYQLEVLIEAEIAVIFMGGEQPMVDRVLAAWPPFVFDRDIRLIAGGPPLSLGIRGASVNDPRINWDPSSASQWSVGDPVTLGADGAGAFNQHTVSGERADERPTGGQGPLDGMIYARRAPMESVGEVGYLLFDAGRPWETVRLLEPDVRNSSRILDRLTVREEIVRRGMVNVNSRQTNALASAFWQAPVEAFPIGTVQENRWLREALTRGLVAQIVSTTSNAPIANLSELKRVLPHDFVDGLLSALLSEYGIVNNKFVRESVVRNSIELLGTRHNLFTVFIAARVFAENYDPANPDHFRNRGDFVQSDQRAVAVVWRDPFRTADSANNQTYSSLVQYFHWLSGALEN
jgi:hypothetical protein